MMAAEPERVRLKRSGGPTSRSNPEVSEEIPLAEGFSAESSGSIPEVEVPIEPPPEPDQEVGPTEGPIYDMELVIYTVSGHKYSAKLHFKQDVVRGSLTPEKARALIKKVEHDIRNRTFQRPITYSDSRGQGATVEYIFNPDNVECVGIVRKY